MMVRTNYYFDDPAHALLALHTIQAEGWTEPGHAEWICGYRVTAKEREGYFNIQARHNFDGYLDDCTELLFD